MHRKLTPRALAAAVSFVLAACGGSRGEASQPPAAAPAAPRATTPAPTAAGIATPADAPLVMVYKSPTCGCCNAWVEHMRQNGFRVEAHNTDNVDAIKDQAKVPGDARSCHTGLVGGYAIEGHVPAEVVRRLLREHPADIAGLAVPGMVTGSPGMEGPSPQHYDVIAFHKDGHTSVYESR